MAYHIYLDLFEGPLDLLLFLVSKAQIDVKDIFISKVTAQYLEFVTMLDEDDMDRASDFIQMATRLLEIKSRHLLPKPRIEGEEEDPEQLLIRQLEDFKLVKMAGERLEEGHEIAKQRFFREPEILEEKIELDLSGTTVDTLLEAFKKMLIVVEEDAPVIQIREIQREEFTVTEKIDFIIKSLTHRKKIEFKELFVEDTAKYEVIITFMALLEMLKLNQIIVSQKSPNAQLVISLRGVNN